MSTTTRLSVANNGEQGNGNSYNAIISANGRYVIFTSSASNLVSGDTNNQEDVFLRDLQTGTTSRVSIAPDGNEINNSSWGEAISADGRYVLFTSDYNTLIRDVQTGTTRVVNFAPEGVIPDGSIEFPELSGDGRYIAFYSYATNLIPGDIDNNYQADVFLHDLQTGTTTRVNRERDDVATQWVYSLDISNTGRYVAFNAVGDNFGSQVFVYDHQTGETTKASVNNNGEEADCFSYAPSISEDGRYVTFYSPASNLVPGDDYQDDIFVRDRQTGNTTKASFLNDGTVTNMNSYFPDISGNGNYVVYTASNDSLVYPMTLINNPELWNIYLYDRSSGTTNQISISSDGTPGNDHSESASISSDGRYIVFESGANNLVSGDTNGRADIFIYDRLGTVEPIVVNGTAGNDTLNCCDETEVINGLAGNDRILAKGGNDTINGGTGSDTMLGGSGDDIYIVDNLGDRVVETISNGTDTVKSSVNYTLASNLENLILTGNAVINGTGNSFNNVITGNRANNILNGLAGNDTITGNAGLDTLDGGLGSDSLIGNGGNDTYIVNSVGDVVVETTGTDTVKSSVSYTLGNNVENLTLTGSSSINGTGNNANNIITGNNANNVLTCGIGNDTLIGNQGRDKFRFNSPTHGIDLLQDFNPTDDCIQVLATAFALPVGNLNAFRFVIGTAATDSNHRFIYNQDTGDLFFDRDGNGTIAAIQIATLPTLVDLTHNNFAIV